MAKKRRQDDEPIKKRKVGRPKKRGRKKVYYKAKKKKTQNKQKGFSSNATYNRVRQVLWQNYKDDFVSYRAFISNQRDENGNPIYREDGKVIKGPNFSKPNIEKILKR